MSMYLSVKTQVSDTKEYQDFFLQMYTGKAKTRETHKFKITLITDVTLIYT